MRCSAARKSTVAMGRLSQIVMMSRAGSAQVVLASQSGGLLTPNLEMMKSRIP